MLAVVDLRLKKIKFSQISNNKKKIEIKKILFSYIFIYID